MASKKVPFAHAGFSERQRTYAKQRGFVSGFAENVATGANDAAAALDIWLHSEGHKRNIEGAYVYTGLGIARTKEGQYYFTQIFAVR
jgi:uncharacterized protein YkwD